MEWTSGEFMIQEPKFINAFKGTREMGQREMDKILMALTP